MTARFDTGRGSRFPARIVAGPLLSIAFAGIVNGQEAGAPMPRKSVTVDNDPLKQRSAAQNIVFGQLVDVDEHRLILQESGANTDSKTTLYLSPESRVFIGDRPVRITDIPASSPVKVYLRQGDKTMLDRVVVLNDDDREAQATLQESTSPVGFGIVVEAADNVPIVAEVRSNGPADLAGVRAGDELLAVNGVTLTSADDLFRATSRLEAGRAATLRIRRDGTARDLKLIAGDGADARDAVRGDTATRAPRTTVVETQDAPKVDTKVTPEVSLGATLGTATDGVAVVRLEKNSPLARAGLQDGDRIKQAAGQNVLTPDSLFRVLNEFDGGSKVELVVLREGEELKFSLILPEEHERVLVEGVERGPTVDVDEWGRTRGSREGNLMQRIRQLEASQIAQQRQIQYLYEALVGTRNQLGYPAFATPFPAVQLPIGDNVTDGTEESTENGNSDNTDGDNTDNERPRQRRRVPVDAPPHEPPTAVPPRVPPPTDTNPNPTPNPGGEIPFPNPPPEIKSPRRR